MNGRRVDPTLRDERRRFRRDVQIVFQDPESSLNPRKRVGEILARPVVLYGLARGRQVAERVAELLHAVRLPAGYAARYAYQLSGGEKQRVGIARALATDPGILLMDEPFGALDAITRHRMQDELLRIQRGVRKTILFVTHDVEEAFRLGEQIAVLSEGKLVQLGTPSELLAHPADDFVRRLVGADSVLRKLQYLPVTAALDGGGAEAPPGAHDLRVPATATLLQAMLTLLETKAPALAVCDERDRCLGLVTLATITRTIEPAAD